MRRLIYLTLVLLSVLGCGTSDSDRTIQVMSYNIRYDNPQDSLNRWDHRKEELTEMLRYYHPDFIGMQEGLVHQLEYIDSELPQYARIGVGRDDGVAKGEFSPIYYQTEKFDLLKDSTFWLSETPSKVSTGWDASMERICTYGLFRSKKTRQKYLVLNAHFDHIGAEARLQSAMLITSKVEELNPKNQPVIVLGDFNSDPNSAAIRYFANEFTLVKAGERKIYGPVGTFTGFEPDAVAENRIDYIMGRNVTFPSYRHIDDKRKNGYYLSDHLPVLASVQVTK